MPPRKRRKSKSSTMNYVIVIAIVAIVSFGVIAYHDGLIGLTSIEDIWDGDIDDGTAVAVKGEVTAVGNSFFWITDDDDYSIQVEWDGDQPQENSIVVVRGEVDHLLIYYWIEDVTSVQVVWIFT